MNIWQLKEYIKDLPDDMELARQDDDNTCYRKIENILIEKSSFYSINMEDGKEYLIFE